MFPSPFAVYLDTNYTATSKDVPAIQTVIADMRRTVKDIDEQLKAYHLLIEQRKSCMASIDRHTALLAPMRRMPDDILLTIFHDFRALPEHRKAEISCKHPSVVLSHVCSKWRSLALEDPRMWSFFVLSLPVFPPMNREDPIYRHTLSRWTQKLDYFLGLTTIWLARSVNYPLTFWLYVSAPEENFEATEERLGRLVQLLCNFSRRWRDVDIMLSIEAQGAHTALLREIVNIAPEEVPLLRSLHLDISLNDLVEGQHWSLETSAVAFPTTMGLLSGIQLRSMTMYLYGPAWAPGHTPSSWATLTRLAFQCQSLLIHYGHIFVIELLNQCPRLVTLEVGFLTNGDDHREELPQLHTRVRHSCLKNFHWDNNSMPLKALAHVLELPALTSLQLPLYLNYDLNLEPAGEALLHWLTRFGPQLQKVSFVEFALDDHPFAEVMECLRNVSVLKLTSGVDNQWTSLPPMAPRSAVRSFDTSWLPNLERLDAKITYGGALFTEESLLAFVASRQQRQPGLRNVTVSFSQHQTIDLRREMEKKGVDTERLKLSVKYPLPLVLEGPFVGDSEVDEE